MTVAVAKAAVAVATIVAVVVVVVVVVVIVVSSSSGIHSSSSSGGSCYRVLSCSVRDGAFVAGAMVVMVGRSRGSGSWL